MMMSLIIYLKIPKGYLNKTPQYENHPQNFVSAKFFFDRKEIKKMTLSVQRSAVESFKFISKNIRVFYIKDVGKCLVAKDLSKAVGYNDDDNARRAVQTHVPEN